MLLSFLVLVECIIHTPFRAHVSSCRAVAVSGSSSRARALLCTGVCTECATYKHACQRRGFLSDDAEWHACMKERSDVEVSPSSLRELLCTILQFNHPSDAPSLVEAFVLQIGDDLKRQYRLCDCVPVGVVRDLEDDKVLLRALVLVDLEQMLDRYGVAAAEVGVEVDDVVYADSARAYADLPNRCARNAAGPEPQDVHLRVPHIIRDELDFDVGEMASLYRTRYSGLKPSQRHLVDTVVAALDAGQGGCFFVDAPGGTGKTWCFNALLAYVRKQRAPALAVASTGIAGLLLSKGRTAHSRFKLHLEPVEGYDLRISVATDSALADLFLRTRLIVWDESSAVMRYHFEALDRFLREVMRVRGRVARSKLPFGGIVVVAGGDFRQTLPIVKHGRSPADIIGVTIKRSPLWPLFTTLRLVDNMRLRSSRDPVERMQITKFAAWQMSVGNGTHACYEGEATKLQLPPEMCFGACAAGGPGHLEVDAVVEWVFGGLLSRAAALDANIAAQLADCAILAPRNKDVEALNQAVLERLAGESVVLPSADEVVGGVGEHRPNPEFLHSQHPSGMAAHELVLKVGAVVMLTHNLCQPRGLCNGSRLVVRSIGTYRLVCQLVGVDGQPGRVVALSRIRMYSSKTDYAFEWTRTQFPVRLAFAMTINKSQGQSMERVAVYLPRPCFAHGQLYVAVSRVRHPSGLRFVLMPNDAGHFVTTNVVLPAALSR